ncbi:trans-sialidase, putative, partial [Trypanosoma cruzi]
AKTTIRLRPLLQEQVNLGQRTARISSLRKWKARWGRKNNPRRRREQTQQPCSQGRPMEMGMRSQYKRAWRLWLEVRGCCPNKARPLFQKITTPNPGAARAKRTALPCSTTAKLMLHDWNVDSTARVCVSRVSMLLLLGLCGAVAVL